MVQVKSLFQKPSDFKTSLLAIALTQDQLGSLDATQAAIASGDFKGEKDQMVVYYPHDGKAKRIALVGLGKESELTLERVRKTFNLVVKKAKSLKLSEYTVSLPQLKSISANDLVKSIAEGTILGHYEFNRFKEEKEKNSVETVNILSDSEQQSKEWQNVLRETQIVCDNVVWLRDYVNNPYYEKTTIAVAAKVVEIAKKSGLKCAIFDEKQLKKMGANLILAVGQGAQTPPRMVVLEYNGNPKSKNKTALVGKGIIFDTGGLNLKPTGFMETMRDDLTGAMTVVATLKTAAELKLPINLIGVCPLAENAIGSRSYKPGDVYVSMSGKTVEIGNTDAEGRLVLADALSYVTKNHRPDKIIDLATLTGACVVALGQHVAGAFSNSEGMVEPLRQAGLKTYERIWEFPLYDEYQEEVKSEIAQLSNMGKTKYAGAITAACFLKEFAGETPWIHLDIAGTAYFDVPEGHVPKRATGWGVRLLTEYLKMQ